MPQLSDITYSRETCVTAVRDYYNFLTKLYLRDSAIIEPPEGGWPTITTTSLQDLGKTDEVTSLLRHLPYIQEPDDDGDKSQGAPFCFFADWEYCSRCLNRGSMTGEDARVSSESDSLYERVPAHVIGLTSGGRDNPVYLLDTELGVIYWPDCPGEIRYDESAPREQIEDDPYDYAPEDEAEWRADAAAWEITDFFEILKDQFRKLHFVPLGEQSVKDIYATYGADEKEMLPMLQRIYREHGWPDLQQYDKRECMKAVQRALEEHYPGRADPYSDED